MRSPSYLYPFIALLLVVLNYYFLKVAQIVILSCFRPLSIAILVKNGDFSRFQLVCDGRTDGRTGTPSHRDARSHLIILQGQDKISAKQILHYSVSPQIKRYMNENKSFGNRQMKNYGIGNEQNHKWTESEFTEQKINTTPL